ncbi:protein-disulfide isomerase [Sinorhizobium terangae]|uniref:Thioredoxin domain-containing protein n=1 Tax=Sinorhizobium terangae TaxID=110322 RepID=A0A6N7LJW4_SINTE|nr:protein-disulfide isomerase [Sinorhizobium terangae]MQX18092.1 thioredoxin domain-containing protein [Sinorhizobium terangae]
MNRLNEQAIEDFHVEATPTILINGKRFTGAPNLEEIRRTIAAAIARTRDE